MIKLNAYESALMLARMAVDELKGKADLRSQLASLRLKSVCEVLEGNVNMHEFEKKMLGQA